MCRLTDFINKRDATTEGGGFCVLEPSGQRQASTGFRPQGLPPYSQLRESRDELKALADDPAEVIVQLGELGSLTEEELHALFYLIKGAGRRCCRSGRPEPSPAMDILLEELVGSVDLELAGEQYRILVAAIALMHPDAIPEASSRAALRYEELGVRGRTTASIRDDVSSLIAELGEGVSEAGLTPPPVLQQSLPGLPETLSLETPGGYWVDRELGVGIGRGERFITVPLIITAVSIDTASGAESVHLAWFDQGLWRTATARRRVVASATAIVGLADSGLPVTTLNAKEIVRYLAQFEHQNHHRLPRVHIVDRCGWHGPEGEKVFVLGFWVFRKEQPAEWTGEETRSSGAKQHELHAPELRFVPEGSGGDQVADSLSSKGHLGGWLDAVRPALEFPVCRLTLVAGLASLLLEIVGRGNFMLHLAGETSSGKTAATQIAASVFGNPRCWSHDSALGTWDTTSVGLEQQLSSRNSLTTFLDDTQRAQKKIVQEAIYAIGNGAGRQRGASDGSRRTPRYSAVVVSTGESDITEQAKAGGARARVLSLRSAPFGEPNRETAEMLTRAMLGLDEHHGVAARHFAQFLVDHQGDWPEWKKRLLEIEASYRRSGDGSGVMERMVSSISVIDLAAELFADCCGEEAFAASPVEPVFEEILSHKQQGDPGLEALQLLCDYFADHRDDFWDPNQPKPADRNRPSSGWLGAANADLSRQPMVGFTEDTFERVLRKWGYDPGDLRAAFRSRGWLVSEGDGRHHRWRVRIEGRSVTLIAINRRGLEAANYIQPWPRRARWTPAPGVGKPA